MKRQLVLAAPLAVIVGAAWLVLRSAPESALDASPDSELARVRAESRIGTRSAPGASAESQGATSRAESRIPAEADRSDTVVVQVVDACGVPRADIEVALAWQLASQPRPFLERVGRTRGPDGTLAVPGMRAHLDNATAGCPGLTGQGFTVVDCLGVTADVVPFDARELPRGIVRLPLPPSGSVLAELVDGTQQPVLQELDVMLEVLAADGVEVEAGLDFSTFHAPGPARVPGVVLGRRLRARLRHPDVVQAVLALDGPRRDGEEVAIRWQLPAECPVLTGQVLTAEGSVAAGCWLAASGRVTGFGSANVRVVMDEDGRFRFGVDPRAVGHPLENLVLDECGPGPVWRASARLGLVLRPGLQDLGTFTLRELPFLVEVEVVDASGKPIAEPGLRVELARAVGGRLEPLLEPSGGSARRVYYGPGRIELFSHADECDLVATAIHPHYLPSAAVPFTRGARDLRITLHQGGSLTAGFLVDPATTPVVELRNDSAPRALPPGRRVPRDDGLAYDWPVLAAGAYTLRVRLPTESEPVLVLPQLEVTVGVPCPDPRLVAIDLRRLIHRIAVRVTSANGESLVRQDVQLRVLDAGPATESLRVTPNQDGVATLVFSRPSISFIVGARGYRPEELREVSADVAVVLAPGQPIRARLEPVALPEGMSVYCYVNPSRRERDLHVYSTSAHRPGETVDIGPLAPGAYELVYCVRVDRTERLATRTIEVLDVDEPQLFTVASTAAELSAALSRLRR